MTSLSFLSSAVTNPSMSSQITPPSTTINTTTGTSPYHTSAKRADRRSKITILVLGDEAVGKSSLIATYVAQHFSASVPGLVTRVRLPPDPAQKPPCVTTIVDTQRGDETLLQHGTTPTTTVSPPPPTATTTRTTTGPSEVNANAPVVPGTNTTKTAPTTATRDTFASVVSDNAMTTTATSSSSLSVSSSVSRRTLAGLDKIDSIVLVYDVEREDTFLRLEHHWLPLIQSCYNGKIPVIVAGNKMDLLQARTAATTSATNTDAFLSEQQQALNRNRQQIVSLMQHFPFVRQCIKCSAKTLFRVNDIFLKAQQAVLYPFTPPLYDLERGRLSNECKRALSRIFRIYDTDHDGLLSDAELNRFQRETYSVPIAADRDWSVWKKNVARHHAPSSTTTTTTTTTTGIASTSGGGGATSASEAVLRDGKFTVAGFWTIFDIFISQDRLEVVWQALRKFGYDDDLNLHLPMSTIMDNDTPPRSLAYRWKLSSSAKRFLIALFHQFDSNHDGWLSPDDILSIFSIVPPPALPPWHPFRSSELFRDTFTSLKETPHNAKSADSSSANVSASTTPAAAAATSTDQGGVSSPSISHSGISVLSASDSLPTVGESSSTGSGSLIKSLSFLEWMGKWHLVASISPHIARVELALLGYDEDDDKNNNLDDSNIINSSSSKSKSRFYYSSQQRRRSRKKKRRTLPPSVNPIADSTIPSREIRVLVIGSTSTGKTDLLHFLEGNFYGLLSSTANASAEDDDDDNNKSPSTLDVSAPPAQTSSRPESSAAHTKINRTRTDNDDFGKGSHPDGRASSSSSRRKDAAEEIAVHFVFIDFPEMEIEDGMCRDLNDFFYATGASNCEDVLVMFVFDSSNAESYIYAKTMEENIVPEEIARVYVATVSESRVDAVIDEASEHCRALDLEPPLIVSTASLAELVQAGGSVDGISRHLDQSAERRRQEILDHLARCTLSNIAGIVPLRARPHENEKRRQLERRNFVLSVVSIAVVAVGSWFLIKKFVPHYLPTEKKNGEAVLFFDKLA